MKDRKQLNARVSPRFRQLVQQDKRRFGKTIDIVIEVALDNWFSSKSPDERHQFYRAHDRTPHARTA